MKILLVEDDREISDMLKNFIIGYHRSGSRRKGHGVYGQ